MYGQERIIVANLDKREFIAMDSPTKLLASTSHLPADGRGAKHDTYCISEKNAVSQGIVNFIEGTDQPDAAWRTLQTYKSGTMTESFKEALYNQKSKNKIKTK